MALRSRFAVVLSVLVLSVVAGGWLLGRGLHGGATPFAGQRLFDDVVTHIERHYVDSVSTSQLFQKALDGMLQELGDPHTLYLRPDRLKRLTESTTGNYTGLGLQTDVRDGWPTVLAPLPGGPADRAGLATGDRIVELAGKSTRGLQGDEVRALMRGPVGSQLSMTIERPGSTSRIPITITRGEIHRRAVRRSALLDGGVGYVDIKIFSDSTALELSRTIDSLSRAGMRSLVLDLRGNPGGLLAQGVSVADLFLDPSTEIVRIRGRVPEANRTFSDGSAQRWPSLPVVVLIDEGSASAAEIVAGALQDHDRALVVGRTSYGKGSAQSLYPTSSGGALKLTTARWYTPAGRSIDRVHLADGEESEEEERERFRTDAGRTVFGGGGITPDLAVGDTLLTPPDRALEVALGKRIPDFRDALTAFAIREKTLGRVRNLDFEVTPAMLDAFWTTLGERGFTFERAVYDAASPLVARLLGREVSRFVFGPDAEARRSIRDDEVITAAARIAAGARSQEELLQRAAAQVAASSRREMVPPR